MPLGAILLLLDSLEFTLSTPLADASLQTNGGEPVQVWFEADRAGQRALSPVLSIPGKISLSDRLVRWSAGVPAGTLREAFGTGGRVLFRLHCGAIMDSDQRPYSNSLEQLIGSKGPRLPGGVLESWVFVRGG